MARITLREIARKLNVSYSTVSLALRGDKRLRPETILRVEAQARAMGYQSDPVVSEGLSRVRRKAFFRETIAWCCDRPKAELGWLNPLFDAGEERAKILGYRIDHYHFESEEPRSLKRLAGIWRARGIRGVILAPFTLRRDNLSFPWEDFIWVKIGDSLNRPMLHRVGRDYAADLDRALEWLKQRGFRRPGFVQIAHSPTIFREPMLHSGLTYYHGHRQRPKEPYFECNISETRRMMQWLRQNRPDSLIMNGPFPSSPRTLRDLVGSRPVILLSPYGEPRGEGLNFEANYAAIGQLSLNFMHHLLIGREYGVPSQEQTILVASHWRSREAEGGALGPAH